MPIQPIATANEVEDALGAPQLVLLKHSTRCPVSAWAWEQIEVLAAAHPDLDIRWVDVVADRALSQAVAAQTGIGHESPQVFVIRDGAIVHHASHMQVLASTLEDALEV